MTTEVQTARLSYDEDKLAGLFFIDNNGGHYFRTECGRVFNHPLDPTLPYALVDAETDTFVGVIRPEYFVGSTHPPLFRVLLLRPTR